MQSPQSQIFNACYITSSSLGYATHDFLPAASAEYPFVYIGEQFDTDRATKSVIYGRVQQTIHIYDNYKKRKRVTDMMDTIKRELRKLNHTDNFYISVKGIRSQVLPDNSTAQSLIHGIIEIDFQFN